MLDIYKNKRILVTGHTGFKGSWLIQVLKTLGAQTYGFSLPAPDMSHFSLLNSNNGGVYGDILDAELLGGAINSFEPEIIFHLAAQPLVRKSYIDPVGTYNTNVIGTLNLLQKAKECDSVRAIVCITTDKVYENKEWVFPYRETDELGGYDMYSSSKACCEILINSFRNSFSNIADFGSKHKILIASARAGNVIGGGDWCQDRLIPDIVRATANKAKVLIRNRGSIRPWQHVLDCLNGYLKLGEKLLENNTAFANSWNFSPYSHESLTVEEVVNSAKRIWDDIDIEFESSEAIFHEAKLLKLDNTRAISALGWKPTWNTEVSIQRTIEWYKEYYEEGRVITGSQVEEFFNNVIK